MSSSHVCGAWLSCLPECLHSSCTNCGLPLPPLPACTQALLAEGAALLQGLEGGLGGQPPRLQRKHAVLAQHASMLQIPPRG